MVQEVIDELEKQIDEFGEAVWDTIEDSDLAYDVKCSYLLSAGIVLASEVYKHPGWKEVNSLITKIMEDLSDSRTASGQTGERKKVRRLFH